MPIITETPINTSPSRPPGRLFLVYAPTQAPAARWLGRMTWPHYSDSGLRMGRETFVFQQLMICVN
jgi:hypothetical protein